MYDLIRFLEGQDYFYNPGIHVFRMTIREPFYKAGKILGWDPPSAGLGINQSIIEFVLKHKAKLLVRVESEKREFWVNYDKIRQFIATHETEYTIPKGFTLNVLPWFLFIGYQSHMEKENA